MVIYGVCVLSIYVPVHTLTTNTTLHFTLLPILPYPTAVPASHPHQRVHPSAAGGVRQGGEPSGGARLSSQG